jgi:hypothetical protein
MGNCPLCKPRNIAEKNQILLYWSMDIAAPL